MRIFSHRDNINPKVKGTIKKFSSLIHRAGSSRKPELYPELQPRVVSGMNLGYVGPKSTPIPLSTDVFNKAAVPSGIRIDEWPVFAIAPKTVPLQTSGMCRCSALRIDGPGEAHYLMHLNPDNDVQTIKEHLSRDIPWNLKDKRTIIEIIPGTDSETNSTTSNILAALYAINPKLATKVRFRHFPDSAAQYGANSGLDNPRTIVSYRGQLLCHSIQEAHPTFTSGGQPISEVAQPINQFA